MFLNGLQDKWRRQPNNYLSSRVQKISPLTAYSNADAGLKVTRDACIYAEVQ